MCDLPEGFVVPKREHYADARAAYRELDRLRGDLTRLHHADDREQKRTINLMISFLQPIAADLYAQEKRDAKRA